MLVLSVMLAPINDSVSPGTSIRRRSAALADIETRRQFYQRFVDAVGQLSVPNTPQSNGFPSFPLERLSNPATLEAFERVAAIWSAPVASRPWTPHYRPSPSVRR